ncbi:hypothetical protein AB0M29_41705 [Streptomyces sp. NPDC051976]|uniref:hypothetical protein n=1 Tax=Streptomyces sp. NPDC051976 TaxID=3154947 RepID=UPI003432DF71
MHMLIDSGAAAAIGVAVHGTAVVSLYLRLRWRVRQEHAHRQYLESLACFLPAGSTLEETGADGSTLRLTMGPGSPSSTEQEREQ